MFIMNWEPQRNALNLSRCISHESMQRFHHMPQSPYLCQLIRKSKHTKVSLISLQSCRHTCQHATEMLQQEGESENKGKLQMNCATFWQDPANTAACNTMAGEITSFPSLIWSCVLYGCLVLSQYRLLKQRQLCHTEVPLRCLIYEKSWCISPPLTCSFLLVFLPCGLQPHWQLTHQSSCFNELNRTAPQVALNSGLYPEKKLFDIMWLSQSSHTLLQMAQTHLRFTATRMKTLETWCTTLRHSTCSSNTFNSAFTMCYKCKRSGVKSTAVRCRLGW